MQHKKHFKLKFHIWRSQANSIEYLLVTRSFKIVKMLSSGLDFYLVQYTLIAMDYTTELPYCFTYSYSNRATKEILYKYILALKVYTPLLSLTTTNTKI